MALAMRALIQRVSEASVAVDGVIVGQIAHGLLVLLGVGPEDGLAEATMLADKTAQLRVFSDEAGRFNRSLVDVAGSALVVSQFTLYADTRRGRRPSFAGAAPPQQAAPLVNAFVTAMRNHDLRIETGVFGAYMQVSLVNDGPVTVMLDSDTFREPRKGNT